MPSYKGHLIGGLLTYLAIIQFMKCWEPSYLTLSQGLLFCLLGSLFPDIDVKSKGQNVFYSIFLGLLFLLLYKQQYCLFVVTSIFGVIPLLVKHRGIFHHIWFLFLLTLGGTWIVKIWCGYFAQLMIYNCWFFFAGALSHVCLDRLISRIKRVFN